MNTQRFSNFHKRACISVAATKVRRRGLSYQFPRSGVLFQVFPLVPTKCGFFFEKGGVR